jgi:Rrf2 family protein
MNLSKTSQYAIRILSYMARFPEVLHSAGHLVKTLNVSDKYLRRILTDLSKAGLIRSVQGRDGGYTFEKRPEQISVMDIINAVEGMEKYRGCVLGFDECSDENPCVLHHEWASVRNKMCKGMLSDNLLHIASNLQISKL